ncbi:MAG: hypothetical protein ACLQUY_09475 [Ktedonobacterales bacterium]
MRGQGLATFLTGLMPTVLLAALDQTIVGTALPRIIGELHGFDRYFLVVTGLSAVFDYHVAFVGKLSDQFGRKWLSFTVCVAAIVLTLLFKDAPLGNQQPGVPGGARAQGTRSVRSHQ